MSNGTEQIFLSDSPSNQHPPALLRPSNAAPTINLENVEDFSKVCRVCATITDLVMPIFSGEGLRIDLADKIKRHLPIKVCATDALPLVVCYQCASALLATHELVVCSQQADAALRTALSAQQRRNNIAEQQRAQQQAQLVKQEPAAADDRDAESRRCEYCRRRVPRAQHTAHLLAAHADLLFHCDECDSYVSRRLFLAHMSAHAAQYDAGGRVARKPTNPNGRLYVLRAPATRPDDTSAPAISSPSVVTLDEDDSSDCEIVEPLPSAATTAPSAPPEPSTPPEPTEPNQPAESTEPNQPAESTEPNRPTESNQLAESTDPDQPVESTEASESPEPAESPEPTESPEPAKKKAKTVRQCPHCPKSYTAASSYFYHLKYTHGQSREHACATCGRRFGTRGALREHAALHEPAASAPALQCDRCPKRFRSKAGVYIHRQTHSDVKRFACAECGRGFRWRAALRRHAARHSAERAHACGCGRAFAVRADLLRHARTHRPPARALACPHAECRATFAQPRYLRAHLKRKHPADDD